MRSRRRSVSLSLLLTFLLVAQIACGQQTPRQRGTEVADQTSEPALSGRHVVVVVGIDQYKNWPVLSNAVSDALGISKVLQDKLGFVQVVAPLVNSDATREAVLQLVEDRLRRELKPDDDLILFFAGHGTTRVDTVGGKPVETGYLVPADAHAPGQDEHWSDYIQVDPFLESVGKLPPRHILVVLDACHSGFALGSAKTSFRGVEHFESALATKLSRRVITSARRDELAQDEGPVAKHSLFTGMLIDGLEWGKVDLDGDGIVTSSEIGLYLESAVGRFSHSQQTPDFGSFYLDDRGEMVLRLEDNSFSTINARAFRSLQQGLLTRFEELTAKVAEVRPDAPETLYLEYRRAILHRQFDQAAGFVDQLLHLGTGNLPIPLSREDLWNLHVELPFWAPVLSASREGFPLEIGLQAGKTKDALQPVPLGHIGEISGYHIPRGDFFNWRISNPSTANAFLYLIYFDQDGRLLTFSLVREGEVLLRGIAPRTFTDSYFLRQDGTIEMGEFDFIYSPSLYDVLLSPPGTMTRGSHSPPSAEEVKPLRLKIVHYTTAD